MAGRVNRGWVVADRGLTRSGRARFAMAGLAGLLLVPACPVDQSFAAPPASQPARAVDLARSAENGLVKLTVMIDRADVAVPEQIKLTVVVESELGVDVTMPDLGGAFGPFAVSGYTDADPAQNDFTIRRERVYALAAMMPGNAPLPGVTVKFADRREKADGSNKVNEGEVATDSLPVTIRSGLAGLKGPASLPMPGWQRLLLWAAGVLVAIIAVALGVRWWQQRRRQAEQDLPKARRVIPHEWALAELDMLAAEDLVGRGRVQEFYYRINWILRRYIELRFRLMAGEQTSEEFIRALRTAPILDDTRKEVLRRFIAACDPVKYARHDPERGEIEWVQASARDFVLETAATGEGDTTQGHGEGRRITAEG
jgi:hypothetical protein